MTLFSNPTITPPPHLAIYNKHVPGMLQLKAHATLIATYEAGTEIIIPIVQIKKLRHREINNLRVKSLVSGGARI